MSSNATTPAVQTRLVTTQADLTSAYAIRLQVFVVEQGVPAEIELDDLDAAAEQVLAVVDGVPAGTGRLVVDGDTGILGRLAVLQEARGTGLGQTLVETIEQRAAQLGLAVVELHAQTQARGFYERLGYAAHGAEYLEAGIMHVNMRKPLPS